MKKVLILTVIAILALGVMALAETKGPTCSQATLTVYSEIGIEQGIAVTAVSHNASFCGASGSVLAGQYTDSYPSGVLLASLEVWSNAATVTVAVNNTLSPANHFFTDSIVYTTGAHANFTGSDGANTSGVFTLYDSQVSNGTAYDNALYVNVPYLLGQQWLTAGHYTLTTKFTVTPAHLNF